MSNTIQFVPSAWPKMTDEQACDYVAGLDPHGSNDTFVIYRSSECENITEEVNAIIQELKTRGYNCHVGPAIYRSIGGSNNYTYMQGPTDASSIYIDISRRYPDDELAALRCMYGLQNELFDKFGYDPLYNDFDYPALTEMFMKHKDKDKE